MLRLFFLLFLLAAGGALPARAEEDAALAKARIMEPTPPKGQRPDFLFLPNGWGNSPEAATADLDRVIAVFVDRPGFRRFDYIKVVAVGRGIYEADGMCTWDAKTAISPATRKQPWHSR
ncbi:hypothetical protein SAMN05444156_3041 [Verrucomicrobium sp. GAS474]|uniref:hypothetical protein n=1 Tax=Verrucomicrobium sp. GAS474 TaxID=1882831 RepID=UPI00087CDF22|nr:hypothetical protein [Verrucomicrobium sp. GAS474]SDU28154.1 hypothetical protein SAMN05444156_3041 [Verrucomicrobium sp. GAS474]